MSSHASFSIDRREAYYVKMAKLIASDPLSFYTRAEEGRKIQSAIKPTDLKPINQKGNTP